MKLAIIFREIEQAIQPKDFEFDDVLKFSVCYTIKLTRIEYFITFKLAVLVLNRTEEEGLSGGLLWTLL